MAVGVPPPPCRRNHPPPGRTPPSPSPIGEPSAHFPYRPPRDDSPPYRRLRRRRAIVTPYRRLHAANHRAPSLLSGDPRRRLAPPPFPNLRRAPLRSPHWRMAMLSRAALPPPHSRWLELVAAVHHHLAPPSRPAESGTTAPTFTLVCQRCFAVEMEDIEDAVGTGAPLGLRLPVMSVAMKRKPKARRIGDPFTPSPHIPGTQTIYMKTFGCSHNQVFQGPQTASRSTRL